MSEPRPFDPNDPVVVVGAGVAGLACAKTLTQADVPVRVIEAGDDVGGRVRTDRVDGFLLDRGFQVLLTSYPDARRLLDYEALDLRLFHAGALVRSRGRFHRLSDPRRHPTEIAQTLSSDIPSFRDRVQMLRLVARLVSTSP